MLSVDLFLQKDNNLIQFCLLDIFEALRAGVIDVDDFLQDLPDNCAAPSRLHTHLTIII
jgi:hypothetical protein